MIKAEQVPEQVWKTLRREIEGSGLRYWPEIVAAALNAWEGMDIRYYRPAEPTIILPLTENGNE